MTKKCTGRGVGRRHAKNAYEQCVRMRKKINQDLVPLMAKTVAALNTLNRSLDIIAREVAQYGESRDV